MALKPIKLLLVLIIAMLSLAASGNSAKKSFALSLPNGKTSSVPILHDGNGQTLLSVSELCKALSVKTAWSPEKRKLLLYEGGRDLQLSEANPFVYFNGKLTDLGGSPKIIRGDMVLSPRAAAVLLSLLTGTLVQFDSTASKLLPATSSQTATAVATEKALTDKIIRKVAVDERKNGTLVTFFLPESLSFDFTYFKPQLNINIVRARISPTEIRRDTGSGLVLEIDAVQFAENAQVSLMLSEKALAPEVRYRSNPPRIEVAIRGEMAAAVSPDTVKDTSKTTLPQPPVPPVEPVKGSKNRDIKTIYIDAGHGGHDGGAINKKLKIYEKNVVLAIAKLTAEKVKTLNPGIEVRLTRDDDFFVPLADRAKIANKGKGNLFISIHANSVKGTPARQAKVNGYSIYFLDVAKNDEARAVAALENSVLELEGKSAEEEASTDVDFILKQAELNQYRNESEELAIKLEKSFDGLVPEVRRVKTGVDQANFYVLRGPHMPSVLVETAFICNPVEANLLIDEVFQNKVADAIAQGVLQFRGKNENSQKR